jgi:hypothetical protein
MGPFNHSRCSFPIPEFTSEAEEREWMHSLTSNQRLELMYLMNLYVFGEEAMTRPMDRTVFRTLTMEEANREDEEFERKLRSELANRPPPPSR